jgi:hypothetical protein
LQSPGGDERDRSDRSHHARNISMDGIESNPLFAGYLPPRSEVGASSLTPLRIVVAPKLRSEERVRELARACESGQRGQPRWPRARSCGSDPITLLQLPGVRHRRSTAPPAWHSHSGGRGERRAQSGDPDRVTGYTPGYAASTSSIASTERSVRSSANPRPPTDAARNQTRKSRPPSGAASPAALSPGGGYLGSGCVPLPPLTLHPSAQGSATSVMHPINLTFSSAHGLVRRWLLIGYFPVRLLPLTPHLHRLERCWT